MGFWPKLERETLELDPALCIASQPPRDDRRLRGGKASGNTPYAVQDRQRPPRLHDKHERVARNSSVEALKARDCSSRAGSVRVRHKSLVSGSPLLYRRRIEVGPPLPLSPREISISDPTSPPSTIPPCDHDAPVSISLPGLPVPTPLV